jgi:hypothetical protein
MYVVDIWDSKNRSEAGPHWVTGKDLSLKEALNKAKKWVEESDTPAIYEVMYRIVGCL